jgi:hypothetical protein
MFIPCCNGGSSHSTDDDNSTVTDVRRYFLLYGVPWAHALTSCSETSKEKAGVIWVFNPLDPCLFHVLIYPHFSIIFYAIVNFISNAYHGSMEQFCHVIQLYMLTNPEQSTLTFIMKSS